MDKHTVEDIEILFDHGGRRDWGKYTFPVIYGMPVVVRWQRHEFHFNLLGQVRRIFSGARYWPNAQETLKRTIANDWIFMSTFGYEGSYSLMKTHYVPLTAYHDPALFLEDEKPLDSPYVAQALEMFDAFVEHAGELAGNGASPRAAEFLAKVARFGRPALDAERQRLYDINGGHLTVLPPDTIDVEYEIIPLQISDGCTGGCAFCKFNDGIGFHVRDRANVKKQVSELRDFFGPDLMNYNAVVLGQNDALAAGAHAIDFAARLAYEELNIAESYHEGSFLYMFGGAHTLLDADEELFEALDNLPFENIHVNVGLESPHEQTLDILGKPQSAADVRYAFEKIRHINSDFKKLNVSCNFVVGDDLPRDHVDAVRDLLSGADTRMMKGTAFISPLENAASPRLTRNDFTSIKLAARMPVYLYLVQRL
jgi:hypothetical protein